ncbi:hypothetical protein DFO67_108184 [Modicisalibacter xianhensis]|uniref:Homeodomain-like domain-containing protein n=1 Tax=Modicisalibacter xianhensis TaxID=442341 RepID=A0A4R8FYB8_9GAMM|nr:hypothetical protein [Halomonas xianhensis]TDX29140.1 hypothetical protein DFO67_108184 [Halomonas xianhensis]
MSRKYRPWSRAEYDRLEALLKQGLTYAQIAVEMGRERLSVQGTAQRIGLSSHDRQGRWRRRDWTVIDTLLAECIETRLMTVPQAAKHITALGHDVCASSLYERIKANPDLKKRARMNAQRRMVSVGQRLQRRRHAA